MACGRQRLRPIGIYKSSTFYFRRMIQQNILFAIIDDSQYLYSLLININCESVSTFEKSVLFKTFEHL